jgi:hypothetical protein
MLASDRLSGELSDRHWWRTIFKAPAELDRAAFALLVGIGAIVLGFGLPRS